ncbi:MAG: DNA sulfur modification protein DndE [Candidatus Methylumidiphilus sp.]
MKPPIEYIRVSATGKDILTKIKKRTGLEHWNELCRFALFRSLINRDPPLAVIKLGETSIEMEWKTFAGPFQHEFTALIIFRAQQDGIDVTRKDSLSEYFKAHLERGIANIRNIDDISELLSYDFEALDS